jgi:response regulator RpfG family c-di-GMP phosphodiesterase
MTPGSSSTPAVRPERETILVADQDLRVLELLQITLSGRGYRVRTARDGDAALEEIERQRPDLIVLGVRLARRSGLQVLERLRANATGLRLPVILISPSASNEARIQGLRLGADDYLVKPFSPRELILKIRTILDRIGDLRLLQARDDALQAEARRARADMLHAREERDHYLTRIDAALAAVEQFGRQPDAEAVAEILAATCRRQLALERLCILIRGRGGATLRPRAAAGLEMSALRALRLSTEGFLCQNLLLAGRVTTLDEFTAYPSAADDVGALSAHGFLHLTPIAADATELLGMIATGEPVGAEAALDPFDQHLLGLLARSAATALQDVDCFAAQRRSFIDAAAQLIATVEGRYPHLRGHSARVQDLAIRIAEEVGAPARVRETIGYVAMLHDLGALDRYDSLQSDPRELSPPERRKLRLARSAAVHELLAHAQLRDVAEGIVHLHESWDGRGIPDGLARESIPLAARIVAIANAYDALTHPRPHRPAYDRGEALLILHEQRGTRFDPRLIDAFASLTLESRDAAQSRSMPTTRGPLSRSK